MSARRNVTRSLVLAVLLVGGVGQVKANLINFDASGTFEDGATLSGTLTIDTLLGSVTAANLSVGAPDSLSLTFAQVQFFPAPTVYEIQLGPTAAGLPNLDIGIPTSGSVNPLIGYTGGPLYSGSDIFYSQDIQVHLPNGFLTQATPEPSSLILCGLGAIGLLVAARRRRSG